MLNAKTAAAVLAASDLERAKAYYAEKLGWQPSGEDEGGVFYSVGGTDVYLYQTDFAGTNKATALMLAVDDLAAEMTGLRAAGVTFAEYDIPGVTTVDGVAEFGDEKAAWFTDSEGNIVALGQRA